MTTVRPPADSAESSPQALLRRVAGGDAAALRELYEATVDGVYVFVLYRVGKDRALAEDVVQETFLSALDRVAEFDAQRGSLRTWLCQLSRNVARKHLRHAKRSEELEMWDRVDRALIAALEGMDQEALVDEVLARRETHDLVHAAMCQLSDAHRRALERKYIEGLSIERLAAELGLTEEAAKSLLARARRAFRETFVTIGKTLVEVSR